MQLIEKLKEEVFILNKKLELIRLNPADLESIIDMDKGTVMRQICDEEDAEIVDDNPFESNKA